MALAVLGLVPRLGIVQIGAASLPLTAGLLGNAAIPDELWGLVFGGALLAWITAESISRVVWSQRGISGARSDSERQHVIRHYLR